MKNNKYRELLDLLLSLCRQNKTSIGMLEEKFIVKEFYGTIIARWAPFI
jgi:hypothetical protein